MLYVLLWSCILQVTDWATDVNSIERWQPAGPCRQYDTVESRMATEETDITYTARPRGIAPVCKRFSKAIISRVTTVLISNSMQLGRSCGDVSIDGLFDFVLSPLSRWSRLKNRSHPSVIPPGFILVDQLLQHFVCAIVLRASYGNT